MEERRLLLAVALSLLVLTAYSLLFSPPPPAAPVAPPEEATPAAAAPGPAGPLSQAETATPAASAAPQPLAVAERPAVADEQERRVEVVAPGFTVAFTNRGARLVSWKLAGYRDARGAPEEMVPAAAGDVRPLDVETGDGEVDALLREALFRPSSALVTLREDRPGTLRFEFAAGALEASKTLEFQPTGLVTVRVEVRRDGQPLDSLLLWGPGLGNATAEERAVQGYQEPGAVALTAAGGIERLVASKLSASGQPLDGVRWAGVESHYFAALFVAAGPGSRAALRAHTVAEPPEGESKALPVVGIAAGRGRSVELYVGAKDYSALKHLGHGLEQVVPVGDWIGPIVVPLIELLRFVQARVGNWGWSIVVLTILINLVMAPFRHYSIVNSLKMAKLGPEMKQIQERYRKVPLMDPRRQQMQEEVAALYARHGMSMGSQMLVGCLPLLLTMPFLIAFYRVLTVSVDLRGAPFLWIPDLAQKDPLYLTPLLMAVSMFAMQKMMPTTLDPAQQRVMMLMPVMLGVMFFAAPAGLNLYWLTSNLWSIAQQGVSMKLLGMAPGPKPREKKAR